MKSTIQRRLLEEVTRRMSGLDSVTCEVKEDPAWKTINVYVARQGDLSLYLWESLNIFLGARGGVTVIHHWFGDKGKGRTYRGVYWLKAKLSDFECSRAA